MNREELIAEAYRRYPVGTVFIPAGYSNSVPVTVLKGEIIRPGLDQEDISDNFVNLCLVTNKGKVIDSDKNKHGAYQLIHNRDRGWAEIVSSPSLIPKDCQVGQQVKVISKTRGMDMTQAKMQRIMASKDYNCSIARVCSDYLEISMKGNGEVGHYDFNYSDVVSIDTPSIPKPTSTVKKDYKPGDRVKILSKTKDSAFDDPGFQIEYKKSIHAEVADISRDRTFVIVSLIFPDGRKGTWNFNFHDIEFENTPSTDKIIKRDYNPGDRVKILGKTTGTSFKDSRFQSHLQDANYAEVDTNINGILKICIYLKSGGKQFWEFNYKDVAPETPDLSSLDRAVEVIQSIPVTIKDAVKSVLGIKEPEVVEDITIAPKKKISSAIVVESTSNITL